MESEIFGDFGPVTKMKFKMHEEQKALVEYALQLAMADTDCVISTLALVHVCEQYIKSRQRSHARKAKVASLGPRQIAITRL